MDTPSTKSTHTSSLEGSLLEGRYRVQERISSGGMATVYRAIDQRLDRAVAVKLLDRRHTDDAQFLERFVREAKTAATLNHPHVVSVYDQGIDGEHTFLVMELVDGTTLRQRLKDGPSLTEAEACEIMEQVLQALAEAHAHDLIHRDVKPENVLISPDGTVKVADFGLARPESPSKAFRTEKGVLMGTVAYVSPEQITESDASKQSDVYAAGVMFFELLTGFVPYSGDTTLAVAYQHVNSDVPAPSTRTSGITPAIDQLVLAATRRDPTQRPSDAKALLELLRQARRGGNAVPSSRHSADDATSVIHPQDAPTYVFPAVRETLYEPDAPSAPPSHRKRRRAPMIAMIAGAVVLLIGIATLGLWWINAPGSTTTPDVTGLPKAQAEQKIAGAGLQVEYGDPEHSETVQIGHVLKQTPSASKEVDQKSTVTLTLSLGPAKAEIPELTGKTQAEAERTLKELKLEYTILEEYSDDVEKGEVISTTPEAGVEVKLSEGVSVTVSKGTPPITVPDVIGLPQNSAEQRLEQAGLRVNVTEDDDSSKTPGTVIKQSLEEGESAEEGDTITITVAGGVIVPDVEGMKYKKARKMLKQVGLEVKKTGGRDGGFVFSQNPSGGSIAEKGDKVTLWVL